MHEQIFTGLYESSICQSHKWKGSQSRASRAPLALPSDRRSENESGSAGSEMSTDLRPIQIRDSRVNGVPSFA
jgi:hypothetical protein